MKKKEVGAPTATVRFLPGTAGGVAKNRAAFQAALEMELSRLNGYKTAVKPDWEGNKENYCNYRERKLKEQEQSGERWGNVPDAAALGCRKPDRPARA